MCKLGWDAVTSHNQTGGGCACWCGPKWRWRQRQHHSDFGWPCGAGVDMDRVRGQPAASTAECRPGEETAGLPSTEAACLPPTSTFAAPVEVARLPATCQGSHWLPSKRLEAY